MPYARLYRPNPSAQKGYERGRRILADLRDAEAVWSPNEVWNDAMMVTLYLRRGPTREFFIGFIEALNELREEYGYGEA